MKKWHMFRHTFPNMPGGKEVAPFLAVHLAAADGVPVCVGTFHGVDPTMITIVETNGVRRGFLLTCIPCLEHAELNQ